MTCNSVNNLSSYCGLVEAKMRASDKYLPGILGSIAMETLDLAGDADSSCDKRFSIVAVIS